MLIYLEMLGQKQGAKPLCLAHPEEASHGDTTALMLRSVSLTCDQATEPIFAFPSFH